MKKFISLLTVLAISVSILLCCSACKNENTDTTEASAESFVIGAHANFPGLDNANLQGIYNRIYAACENFGQISYVVSEGEPTQTKTVQITKSDKSLPEFKLKEIAKRNAKSILASLSDLKALTPEVDTLATIRLGAQLLNASSLDNKNLIVYDSGLCTTGLLSQLTANVLETDEKLVVDKLESLHALPDLENITVTWFGLGAVAGEQEKFPDSYLYSLKTLWTEIVQRSGGTVVFDSTPVTGQQTEDLPHVTAVDFPVDSLGIEEITDLTVMSFHENTIKFTADTADFADEASAEASLKPIAEYLKKNTEKKILIVGTTARIGDGDGKALSKDRAIRVRDVLTKYGASPSQIDVIGLGSSNNIFRIDDHNADGTLNEQAASQNRAIYIIAADSSTAKQLLRNS